MARKTDRPTKDKIVAFKVEEELAEFLSKLPNKSEFIRRAILAQFNMACPLCSGTGVVPRGLYRHYAEVIDRHNDRACERCGQMQRLVRDLNSLDEADRPRYEQFLHGGPFYCTACYAQTPACDDCGWHIPDEQVAEHQRVAHAD
jgi:hypothetical protein